MKAGRPELARRRPASPVVAWAVGLLLVTACGARGGPAGLARDGAVVDNMAAAASDGGPTTADGRTTDGAPSSGSDSGSTDGPAASTDAHAPADGPAASTDAPAPGNTRLEARQLESEGAPPLVQGVWDTRENVACEFVLDEAGQLRCLPTGLEYLSASDSYADSKCQQAVSWTWQNDGKAPARRPWAFPSQIPQAACAPVRYQALRPIPDETPLFSMGTNGCTPLDTANQAPSSIKVMLMVADAPDRWEPVTERSDLRLSGRLHVVEHVTPDGARFTDRVFDDRWGMACKLYPATAGGSDPGGLECLPPLVTGAGAYFADDQCTSPLALARAEACVQPAFIQEGPSARYALGPSFIGPLFANANKGAACLSVGAPTGSLDSERAFAVGTPLGADAVASVHQMAVGTGRLRLRGLVGDDDAVTPMSTGLYPPDGYTYRPYFDTVANEDCQPMWTPDGQVRCIPASVPEALDYFADSACTRFIFPCDGGAACDTRRVIRTKRVPGPIQVTFGYATSTRLDTTNIYYVDPSLSGACVVIGLSVKGMSEATGNLSWDQFPALQERHPLSVRTP